MDCHVHEGPDEMEPGVRSVSLCMLRKEPGHVAVVLSEGGAGRDHLQHRHQCLLKGGGQWQLALGLLSSMIGMSVVQDEVSFNAAIRACEKTGQWQLALSLLSSMPDMRLTPDVLTSGFI
ncbi:unnamed protein product [Polarella glacialis]|uniref:Uncharacterized protein n=1 Tax=Polarella glacialis TaxID=89957 RepID=A0A813FNV2_POLGL|nr:unnamed protein product [Polarella glacialis]